MNVIVYGYLLCLSLDDKWRTALAYDAELFLDCYLKMYLPIEPHLFPEAQQVR